MSEMQLSNIQVFFAAANTGSGFYSLYDQAFRNMRRMFIIKGGPGTGKSRFMREVGNEAERRGLSVEYILCSSDPASLDGVILPDLGIALADGTAPHTMEPQYPGSRDEIVNLGDFWKADKLIPQHDYLSALARQKADCYAEAYRFLSAAEALHEEIDALLAPAILQDKLEASAARLAKALRSAGTSQRKLRLTTAISMDGLYHLDTLAHMADRVQLVRDRQGIAHRFFGALENHLEIRQQNRLLSLEPLNPSRIDGIYLPEAGCALVTQTEQQSDARPLTTDRFIDHQRLAGCRQRLRFCRKCADSMRDAALASLAEAKAIHFALEKHYSAAMDFRKKEEFTKKFITKLLN